MTITGQFQVKDWQEEVSTQLSGERKVTRANVKQQYSGSLTGTSSVIYQMYYRNSKESCFSGVEIINGELEGEKVELILTHQGKFEAGVASSEFQILDATTDKLIGQKGKFKSGTEGMAEFTIG